MTGHGCDQNLTKYITMTKNAVIYSTDSYGFCMGTCYQIFSNIFDMRTTNLEHAKLHSNCTILIFRYELLLHRLQTPHSSQWSDYMDIFKYRKSKGLPVKLIIDCSLEGVALAYEVERLKALILFKEHGITLSDILFINNDVLNRRPISDIGKYITIDYHSLDAYNRCVISAKNPTDNTLIADRPNVLNLLIGKLKTRPTRFLAAYYFYKHGLLDNAVLGIHALPEDILSRMQQHPKYYDMGFYNKILTCLGSADSVCIRHETNEGWTASDGGWPFDPSIFKNSAISYVCETYDIDKANFPFLVTEKTYRPIINKQPFVMQGSPGQLNTIKSLGFETFSSIIDESYNEYELLDYSHVEKTVLAAKDFLTKLPNNIDKVQEIVNFNYNHWLTCAKNEYDKTSLYLLNFINTPAV